MRTVHRKGRFRQFTQCDIDILGDATTMAEIELILATTTGAWKDLPEERLTVASTTASILKGMALYCGFPEDGLDQVFITLDKMDKIGLDGVKAELLELGYAAESVEKYAGCYPALKDAAGVRGLGET